MNIFKCLFDLIYKYDYDFNERLFLARRYNINDKFSEDTINDYDIHFNKWHKDKNYNDYDADDLMSSEELHKKTTQILKHYNVK